MRVFLIVVIMFATACGADLGSDKRQVKQTEDCWAVPVEDCVDRGCALRSGSRYDHEEQCHLREPAFCYPPDSNHTQQQVTAIGPDGDCWIFGSGGVYPTGWQEEDGDRACAYSTILCEPDERCWGYEPDACPDDNCAVVSGALYDESAACYATQPAYCSPKRLNCASQFTTTLDDAGGCWLMNGICAVPSGWMNEDGSRSCPYVTDFDECS